MVPFVFCWCWLWCLFVVFLFIDFLFVRLVCFERIVCIKVYLLRGMVHSLCGAAMGNRRVGRNKEAYLLGFCWTIWGGMVVETVENVCGVCSVLFWWIFWFLWEEMEGRAIGSRRWSIAERTTMLLSMSLFDLQFCSDVFFLTLFSRRSYIICLVGWSFIGGFLCIDNGWQQDVPSTRTPIFNERPSLNSNKRPSTLHFLKWITALH